jgi:hypothetical protein
VRPTGVCDPDVGAGDGRALVGMQRGVFLYLRRAPWSMVGWKAAGIASGPDHVPGPTRGMDLRQFARVPEREAFAA